MAASVAVFGLRAVMTRNIDLVSAHEENARLAVDNERTRFARDLHDILGHSLTVITVKAELAQKLLDVDPDRAAPRSPTSSGSAATRSATYAARSRATARSPSPASWSAPGSRCGPPRSTPSCRTRPTTYRPNAASCSPGPSARA